MSAIASSRINKSGKKFVPKAPVRRPAAARAPLPVSKEDDVTEPAAEPAAEQQPSSPPPPPAQAEPERLEPQEPTPEAVPEAIPEAVPEAAPEVSDVREDHPPTPEPVAAVALPDTQTRTLEPEERSTPTPVPVSIPTPISIQPRRGATRPAQAVPVVPEVVAEQVSVDRSTDASGSTPSPGPSGRKRGAAPAAARGRRESASKRRKTESHDAANANEPDSRTASPEPIEAPKPRTKASRTKKATREDNSKGKERAPSADDDGTTTKKSKPRRPSKKAIQDLAAEVVEEATQGSGNNRRGRQRQTTPEDAESHEIVASATTMADLTKDTRLGKKSERELKLQNTDWDEVKRKRKLLEEARLAGPPKDLPAGEGAPPVPQLAVVNGQLVAVEGSQFVDAGVIDETTTVAINEDDIVNRINSGTLGRKKNHLGRNAWDEAMTQRFYKGLRTFGTDFSLICQMFPGMSRRHVKSKFVKEERRSPELINAALTGPREEADLEELARINNVDYGNVADFDKELEEVTRKEEAEHAKAEAERLKQSNAQAEETGNEDEVDGEGSAKENHYAGIAGQIVNAATSGGRKGKKGRLAGRKALAKNQGLAGGEAVILGEVEH